MDYNIIEAKFYVIFLFHNSLTKCGSFFITYGRTPLEVYLHLGRAQCHNIFCDAVFIAENHASDIKFKINMKI